MKGATEGQPSMSFVREKFQSTHPWRVRPGLYPSMRMIDQDFNPRTREGCDFSVFTQVKRKPAISIHAPVKGATISARNADKRWQKFQSTHPWRVRLRYISRWQEAHGISIHAPVKGATTEKDSRIFSTSAFQSTHPWRVRLVHRHKRLTYRLISIHAPVKGATMMANSTRLWGPLFQSTHPWRVRRPSNWLSHYLLSHQSYCELIDEQFNFWVNYPGIAHFYRNQDGCEALIYFMCDSASHRFFHLVKSSGYT